MECFRIKTQTIDSSRYKINDDVVLQKLIQETLLREKIYAWENIGKYLE